MPLVYKHTIPGLRSTWPKTAIQKENLIFQKKYDIIYIQGKRNKPCENKKNKLYFLNNVIWGDTVKAERNKTIDFSLEEGKKYLENI